MPLRWAVPAAAALLLIGLAEAQAQAGAPAEQKPPCYDQFMPLRQEVDKRFGVAKTALDRKAPAAELCRLLTRFTEAESTMIKYVEENSVWCGFPPDAVQNLKAGQSKSAAYRKQACAAAAASQAPRRPAGPSLSDALSAPVPDANTTRTGRGTLDSLGGNPLAR